MAHIKFDVAAKYAAENPQVRRLFEMFGDTLDPKKLGSANASKVRPFVSEMAWAIFSAYQAIVLFAVMQIYMLKTGLNAPNLLDPSAVTKLAQTVLPHHTAYLEQHGASGYHYLLDELESRLLKELQNILQGGEADRASVEQAAVILRESERVMETISNAATKQSGA